MPPALTLLHAVAVRVSMEFWVVVQRFCVLSPSVRRIITWSVSAGTAGALYGLPPVSTCQALARPIVIFVLPTGVMSSTLLFRLLQELLSVRSWVGHTSD